MPSGSDSQMKAIVRIWWFGGSMLRGAAKVLGAGHGSVEVHGFEDRAYMTWAASGDAPLASSRSSESSKVSKSISHSSDSSRTVRAGNNYSYANDLNAYGKAPDWTETIPVRDPREPFSCGLEAEMMLSWWSRAKVDGTLKGYRVLSKEKNCDGVTVLALLAGLANCYAPPPSNTIYQGASSLRRWVVQINEGILTASQKIKSAMQVIQAAEHYLDRQAALTRERISNRMPTVAEWKSVSRVSFGRRKEQVAAIDQLLGDYHAIQGDYMMDIAKRRIALFRMLHQIALHIATKPRSSRRRAVVDLGRRVIKAIKAEHDKLDSYASQPVHLHDAIAGFDHAREWHKIPRRDIFGKPY